MSPPAKGVDEYLAVPEEMRAMLEGPRRIIRPARP